MPEFSPFANPIANPIVTVMSMPNMNIAENMNCDISVIEACAVLMTYDGSNCAPRSLKYVLPMRLESCLTY